MKHRTGLPAWVYALMGVLVICGVALTLSRRPSRSEPSIGSYGPSGLRVLAELLKDSGYRLDATRDSTPILDPKTDVAVVVFTSAGEFQIGGMAPKELDAVRKSVESYAHKGGRLVQSTIGADFSAVMRASDKTSLTAAYADLETSIYGQIGFDYPPDWVVSEPEGTDLWRSGSRVFASISPIGEGEGLFIADMSGATNHFIDREDNAAVFIETIRRFAPEGSRLVFLEASWGNVGDPGFFESIGPWAAAGWGQLVFLGVVVIFTLGKPFGIPDSRRSRQTGQRELVDAYGHTLKRARATDLALHAVLSEADSRLRRALKMDSGLDRQHRDKLIPEHLTSLIAEAERAAAESAPPDIALDLAEKIDREVTAFCGDRRVESRRRRKS